MRLLAFLLFGLILILGVVDSNSNKKYEVWYKVCFLLMVAFVGFRPIGIDQDSVGYLRYYELGKLVWLEAEPTYGIICVIAEKIWEFRLVLIIYAILGVSLKFRIILANRDLLWQTLLIYFSSYFLLHEFTQIRASIASGIFLIALEPLKERKKLKYILLIFIAALFHYSALVLLPLVFIKNNFNKKWRWIVGMLIPTAIILKNSGFNPLISLPIDIVQRKMDLYVNQCGETNVLNIYNLVYIVKYATLYVLLFNYNKLVKYRNNLPILLKVYGLSLFAYIILSNNTILSMRISELLGVVEIVLIPYLSYLLRPRWLGNLLVIIIATSYLLISIYFLELIYPNPKL